MKKLSLILLLLVASFSVCEAQTVNTIMNRVLNKFNNSKSMSAEFSIASPNMNVTGEIVMSGKMFRIVSKDYICWYNGEIQWVYSTATDEVNILEPSKEELESNNPYFAVMRYNSKFKPSLRSQTDTDYIVVLTSRNMYVDVSNIQLTIDKSTYKIKKAVATMIDDSTQTIELANYKVDENIPASVFVFDNKLVPQGTPVIDLR